LSSFSFEEAAMKKNIEATAVAETSPCFELICREHYDFVRASVLRLGAPRADVDDLTQTAFITIQRRLHTYDPARPLKPWLYGIVFRVVSDYRRLARHRREVHADRQEFHDYRPGPDKWLEQLESRRLVTEGLRGIKKSRRDLFILYEIEGLPMREVAESMSIPLFTAYSRLRKARDEFASHVRQHLAQSEPAPLAA
jgi:RNA polymerase sigma-70 factor (ECF subfamily)